MCDIAVKAVCRYDDKGHWFLMSPDIVFFSVIEEKITKPGTEKAKEKNCNDFENYHGKSFFEFFRKGLSVFWSLLFSGPELVKPAESPGTYLNSTGTRRKISLPHLRQGLNSNCLLLHLKH